MLALLWMTVSLPVVSFGRQQAAVSAACVTDHTESGDAASTEEDESRAPFGNSEEKAPSPGANTLTEEYLSHDIHDFHLLGIFLSHHPAPEMTEYLGYDGELLCPPPNA